MIEPLRFFRGSDAQKNSQFSQNSFKFILTFRNPPGCQYYDCYWSTTICKARGRRLRSRKWEGGSSLLGWTWCFSSRLKAVMGEVLLTLMTRGYWTSPSGWTLISFASLFWRRWWLHPSPTHPHITRAATLFLWGSKPNKEHSQQEVSLKVTHLSVGKRKVPYNWTWDLCSLLCHVSNLLASLFNLEEWTYASVSWTVKWGYDCTYVFPKCLSTIPGTGIKYLMHAFLRSEHTQ